MIHFVQPISLVSLSFNLLIAILAFYSAWINILQGQITSFGLDALVVYLAHIITKKRAEKLREDPNLPRRMGIAMVLLGLSSLRIIVMFFMKK